MQQQQPPGQVCEPSSIGLPQHPSTSKSAACVADRAAQAGSCAETRCAAKLLCGSQPKPELHVLKLLAQALVEVQAATVNKQDEQPESTQQEQEQDRAATASTHVAWGDVTDGQNIAAIAQHSLPVEQNNIVGGFTPLPRPTITAIQPKSAAGQDHADSVCSRVAQLALDDSFVLIVQDVESMGWEQDRPALAVKPVGLAEHGGMGPLYQENDLLDLLRQM
jgi:hypothetical protein